MYDRGELTSTAGALSLQCCRGWTEPTASETRTVRGAAARAGRRGAGEAPAAGDHRHAHVCPTTLRLVGRTAACTYTSHIEDSRRHRRVHQPPPVHQVFEGGGFVSATSCRQGSNNTVVDPVPTTTQCGPDRGDVLLRRVRARKGSGSARARSRAPWGPQQARSPALTSAASGAAGGEFASWSTRSAARARGGRQAARTGYGDLVGTGTDFVIENPVARRRAGELPMECSPTDDPGADRRRDRWTGDDVLPLAESGGAAELAMLAAPVLNPLWRRAP